MNPAITAAIIASQKSGHSVDDLIEKLRKARAFSASSAITLPDYQREKVDEAIGLGLVNRSTDGKLHLNERAAADRMQSHGWTAMLVILIVLSIMASIIALASL